MTFLSKDTTFLWVRINVKWHRLKAVISESATKHLGIYSSAYTGNLGETLSGVMMACQTVLWRFDPNVRRTLGVNVPWTLRFYENNVLQYYPEVTWDIIGMLYIKVPWMLAYNVLRRLSSNVPWRLVYNVRRTFSLNIICQRPLYVIRLLHFTFSECYILTFPQQKTYVPTTFSEC